MVKKLEVHYAYKQKECRNCIIFHLTVPYNTFFKRWHTIAVE
jgi:hypothetical protein